MKPGNKTFRVSAESNPFILGIFLVICAIGLFTNINIGASRATMYYFYRQAIYMVGGVAIAFTISKIDVEKLRKFIGIALFGCIILLILVLVVGANVKGATRSIDLVFFKIQPSILARIVVVLYFANLIDKKKDIIPESRPSVFFTSFFKMLFWVAVTMVLIFVEKHLSTLIIMGSTLFLMLFLAGIRKLTLFIFVLAGVIALSLVLTKGAEYRSERIEIFKKYSLIHKYLGFTTEEKFDKEKQIKESLTALSSGKYFGTGEGKGMAKHLYLPEARTDYVFSIIGEEFGFVGGTVVIILYFALFFVCFKSSWRQPDLFLRLAGCGLALNLFLNVLINIGVAISALPSTGVTLPFISYGGTSYLINASAIGLLINISKPRKEI